MARVVVALVLCGAAGYAIAQTTLLGNCGANITGIQLSTGNIYCITAPSPCTGVIDLSTGCAKPMLGGL